MKILLLVFSCLVKCLIAGGSPAQFNLEYVTNTRDCQGPLPTVEISLRYSVDGDVKIPQEFSQWKLVHYYNGNCSSHQTVLADQSPANGTKYQFRVEMSSGSPCHCVKLTHATQPFASVLTAWTDGSFWCGTEQPNGPLLCAVDSRRRFFLSRVITVNTDGGEIAMCNENSLSSHNTTDLAVGYTGVFGTCPETQCSPLMPLQQDNVSVMIGFSMILNLNKPPNCRQLCNANEGMLLRADSALSTAYLHFYYDKTNYDRHKTRIPQFKYLYDSRSRVQLSYDNHVTDIRIPGTLNSQIGLQNYNENVSQIVDRVVRLKWEQHTQTPHARENRDCDTISLDSTAVSLNWNNCVRKVLDEDFDDPQIPTGWNLFHTVVSTEEMLCLSTYPCLYFVGVNTTTSDSVYRNERFATSPVLDLRVVRAVKPPPASRPVQVNTLTCDNGLKQMMITFQLMMTRYQYPTPCNEQDTTPKGVLLSVSGDQQLAYYAPLAHTNWNELILQDLENMRFMSSEGVDVPIWSPLQNQVTTVTACVNTTDRDTLEVVWRQDNFAPGGEHWYLHIERVMVEDFINISDISAVGSNSRYTMSLVNGGTSPDPGDCALPISPTFIGLTLNNENSRSRAVTLTITSSSPSLSPSLSSPSHSSLSPSSYLSLTSFVTSSLISSSSSLTIPPSLNTKDSMSIIPSTSQVGVSPNSATPESTTGLELLPSATDSRVVTLAITSSSFSPSPSLSSSLLSPSHSSLSPSSSLSLSSFVTSSLISSSSSLILTPSSLNTKDTMSIIPSTSQVGVSNSSYLATPEATTGLESIPSSTVASDTPEATSLPSPTPSNMQPVTPAVSSSRPVSSLSFSSSFSVPAETTFKISPTLLPVPMVTQCPQDGVWNQANPCTSSAKRGVATRCSNMSQAIRVCHCNGTWGRVHCKRSLSLVTELIEELLPEEGLKTILELPSDEVTDTQRVHILRRALLVQSRTNISNTFVESFIRVVDLGLKEATQSVSGFDLINLLKEVALGLRKNATISLPDTKLVVQEVFPHTGPVQGIRTEDSYIILPAQLFRDKKDSVFVASLYYRNLSHVMPDSMLVSPVIYSTLANSTTGILQENVSVFFDLRPRAVAENKSSQCVLATQRSWSDSGCQTVEYRNGSVLCLCDRLAHYAVRLSPNQTTPTSQPAGPADIVGVVFGVLFGVIGVAILVLLIVFLLLALWKRKSKLNKDPLSNKSSIPPNFELANLQSIPDDRGDVSTLQQKTITVDRSLIHAKDDDETPSSQSQPRSLQDDKNVPVAAKDDHIVVQVLPAGGSPDISDDEEDNISFCSHEDQLVSVNFADDVDELRMKAKRVACSHRHKHK